MKPHKPTFTCLNLISFGGDPKTGPGRKRKFFLTSYGGSVSKWQFEEIKKDFLVITGDTKILKNKKDAASSIFYTLNDGEPRRAFCQWAWYACLGDVIPKSVFSRILINTHTGGKVGSLLSCFPLAWRNEMFELADSRHLMSKSEYQRFLSLPDEVKIYRGGSGVSANKLKYGMSWTTNKGQATWFANRFTHRGQPVVIEAVVKKENIFGCFDYEDEVIVRAGGRVSKMEIFLESDTKAEMGEFNAKINLKKAA